VRDVTALPELRRSLQAEDLNAFIDPAVRSCLLMTGEGGAGKTGLACQLGRRLMSASAAAALDHPVLAVLIAALIVRAGGPQSGAGCPRTRDLRVRIPRWCEKRVGA